MIQITLDTNCIINLLDIGSGSATSVEELTEIIRYGLEGDVNIAITTRVGTDVRADKDESRKNELIRRLSIFPIIGTIGRYDTSTMGGGDVWVGEEHKTLEAELKKILFPTLKEGDAHYSNKINDIDHLIGHKINNRDIFVTDDRQILRKAETLKASLNLSVMTPKEALEYLNLQADKLVLVQEFQQKFLQYKEIVLQAMSSQEGSPETQDRFEELRKWMILKYPKIKDGLFNFRFAMISSPTTRGNRVFDQRDIIAHQTFNERINGMLRERTPFEVIETIAESPHNYGYMSPREQNERAVNFLNQLEDTLLGFVGYLSD